jgi:hypothetical protein
LLHSGSFSLSWTGTDQCGADTNYHNGCGQHQCSAATVEAKHQAFAAAFIWIGSDPPTIALTLV